MAYFSILVGLRGCYMPDSSYIVKCDTRKELKNVLEDESVNAQEGAWGLNKKAIAWAANKAWASHRSAKNAGFDMSKGSRWGQLAIMPFGLDRKTRPYSIEIHAATRADYLNQNEA